MNKIYKTLVSILIISSVIADESSSPELVLTFTTNNFDEQLATFDYMLVQFY